MIKIPTEQFQRVVGYYRPYMQANPGKRAEIDDRRLFSVKKLPELLKKELTKQQIFS